MVRMEVKIGALKLKNPVMTASGTFGPEYGELTGISSLGAYIAKTITLKARQGNPPPRVIETPSGMLNSIGLANNGLDDFLKNKLPLLKKLKTAVIASIAGDDEGEFVMLAKTLEKTRRIDAIELNLSCPNVRHGARDCLIAQDEKATHGIVDAVRKAVDLPIITKLSPNVTDITKIARAAESAGADAVSLVNTFMGMAVDVDTRKPRLGNITGGLSGPAIKPLALRMVWQTYNKIKIPVIGMGGIMGCEDALEFMICGSSAVQVGTASFVEPAAACGIITGIRRYLKENKINDVKEIVGTLKT